MRNPILLAVLALSAVVPAQTGRKATRVGNAEDFTVLGASTQPGSVFAGLTPAVNEVQRMQAVPNLDAAGARIPGQFQLCLTVVRAGGGGATTLLGILDTTQIPWTFTDNTATLLPGVNVAGLTNPTISSDLLVFAVDNGTNVVWSVRSSRTVGFPALVNTSVGSPADVVLVTIDGAEAFAYSAVGGSLLEVRQSGSSRTKYPGDPFLQPGFDGFVRPPFLDVHSPDLLIDAQGNARAIIHAADMGGPGSAKKARPWMTGVATLAGVTGESRQFHTGPNDDTEMDHPCSFGGSTFYPTKPVGGSWLVPKLIRIVASSGGSVSAANGGTFRLSAWLPFFDQNNPPPAPWAVTILIGVPGPDITVPGFAGKLALALSPPFNALPARSWGANTLSADWTLPAPPLPMGTTLWSQTLAFDPSQSFGGFSFYFGNTSEMTWN